MTFMQLLSVLKFRMWVSFSGKLIGAQGCNIDMIRRSTQCEVSVLRPHEYEAAVNATFCSDITKFTRHYIRKHLLPGPEPPRVYHETQVGVIRPIRCKLNIGWRCLSWMKDWLFCFTKKYF